MELGFISALSLSLPLSICVCVRDREKEREGQTDREKRGREGEKEGKQLKYGNKSIKSSFILPELERNKRCLLVEKS